jgi:hypothetical protein
MDRFSIHLKKKPKKEKKGKKKLSPKFDIQAIGENSRVVTPPSEVVETLSENQLSELIFNYNPQEREILNSTFGQLSPEHEQNEMSSLTLMDHINHYFQEKDQKNQNILKSRYQIIKESTTILDEPKSPETTFGRKPRHASKNG